MSEDEKPREIEVTPAMMAAGAQALSEFYLSLSDGGLGQFPLIVKTVFCRMVEARR